MKEVRGNIWYYYSIGSWVAIPTNGTVKKNGEAVMGRGLASQAKSRVPVLQTSLGDHLSLLGNRVHCFRRFRLITLPVKHNWWEKADPSLIVRSLVELVSLVDTGKLSYYQDTFLADIRVPIFLPRLGCGNGQLDWKDVKPILEKYLDDRFTVVQN